MSRLRVRWWPLTLIKSAPLLFVLFFFLPPNTNLNWGWGWGRLMDGPLLFRVTLTWADCCQDVILSSVIIYFTKDVLNLEQKKKTWPFQKDIGKDSIYLKSNFCTVFLSAKQRSTKCPTWNSTKTYTSAVCEPSPRWPCSIAGLAVAVFIALPCVCTVQYFSFNVVPATECSSDDGWWRLKHAERRVKSKYALFLSVSMKNQWNKVFLSVSGELQSWMSISFRWPTRLLFSSVWFAFFWWSYSIEVCVCNFSYSFLVL